MFTGIPDKIKIEDIHLKETIGADVSLQIARFDLIDPIISGNKLYKLFYFIQEAIRLNKSNIVTQGGAYSNHLIATAKYCQLHQLKCYGLVRGEEPVEKSVTLLKCERLGMRLIFLTRIQYRSIKHSSNLNGKDIGLPDDFYFIPEGGFDQLGAKGAALMMSTLLDGSPTHIGLAVGTSTTLAGMAMQNISNIELMGFTVLKGFENSGPDISKLISVQLSRKIKYFNGYHFGGYAKKNSELIRFMNHFYEQTGIPTDFVYTGKLLFGMIDMIQKNYFRAGSRIIVVHSGGLQGNNSLQPGELIF